MASDDSSAPGDGSKYVLYAYAPSLAAAIIFTILFLLTSSLHLYQLIRTRTWFMIPLLVGGFFEWIGYIGRAVSSQQSPDYALAPYVVQSILLLVAPALFAASIYMELGRIIRLTDGEVHSLVRTKWLTTIFVSGDVFSFLMQSSGAGIMAKGNNDSMKTGEKIIIGGLLLQCIFFGFFVIVAILFHRKASLTIVFPVSQHDSRQAGEVHLILTFFRSSSTVHSISTPDAMTLTSADACPGRILWLPKASSLPSTNIVHNSGIDARAFDHPVVILSRPVTAPSTAIIQTITSFNDQDLATRHPLNQHIRKQHLLIKPAPTHPDGFACLELAEGASLRKNSYVKTERRYSIEWRNLHRYINPNDAGRRRSGHYTLTAQSLEDLIKHNELYSAYRPEAELTTMTRLPTPSPPQLLPLPQLSPPLFNMPGAWPLTNDAEMVVADDQQPSQDIPLRPGVLGTWYWRRDSRILVKVLLYIALYSVTLYWCWRLGCSSVYKQRWVAVDVRERLGV
ncbi:MAG: hypothetical protein M1836_007007 [Candelina mexicana]|nr:MAG: hypothetical protein M1836_007007 [Candelina mexicana]